MRAVADACNAAKGPRWRVDCQSGLRRAGHNVDFVQHRLEKVQLRPIP